VGITNEILKQFICDSLQDDSFITDFGYLVIPDDGRLNDEALCSLKFKFKDYIDNQGSPTTGE